MSYIGRYSRFIESCKKQVLSQPYEVHHVVPRSLGGTDAPENLVKLTLRQHYIAHWMLWKAYGGKMAQAFFMMNHDSKYKRIGSKGYEQLRTEAKVNMSKKRKEYMSNPAARDNLRKHRANQVISAESYAKQAKVISSLVWMNDGVRSYRVKPELVQDKLNTGLNEGRLMTFIDEQYRQKRSNSASRQWAAVKAAGRTNLVSV